MEHRARGAAWRKSTDRLNGRAGNILELERHHLNAPREFCKSLKIVIRRIDLHISDLARGGIGVGRIDVNPVAHPPRGNGEHATQLSAAENAERRARINRTNFRHAHLTPHSGARRRTVLHHKLSLSLMKLMQFIAKGVVM